MVPPPIVVRQDESLFCDIKVVKTSHGVRITPIVRSDRFVSGEYSIVITRKGGGGSSDISQGGPFDAPRGVKQELGFRSERFAPLLEQTEEEEEAELIGVGHGEKTWEPEPAYAR